MGLTSLQVCMDSSDWLQGTIHEETGMESSSPDPCGDMQMLKCSSRPLIIERRLRPPHHDQAMIKCPRCESTHTKFCYYNNYSLTQPRYFCKSCRRYWTKGGTLRNIPVGGGCRKNKKLVSTTKKSSNHDHQSVNNNNNNHNPTDLHLNSFPQQMHLSHLNNRNYDFMGNGEFGGVLGDNMSHGVGPNLHAICSPYGMSQLDCTNFMDSSSCQQRMMLPNYDANEDHQRAIDVKPNTKLLSLEWQDHGYSETGKLDTYGYYSNNLGSWSGMMNNYGPSTTNLLV